MKFLRMKYLSFIPVWEQVVHQDTVAVATVVVVVWRATRVDKPWGNGPERCGSVGALPAAVPAGALIQWQTSSDLPDR